MFDQAKLIKQIDDDFEKNFGCFSAFEKACGQMTLEDIFTIDSVYIAAKRCSSGFMNKKDTQKFMESPWQNSMKLCNKVLSGKFEPAYYKEHNIIERGKERIIKPPTFECKVVQKTLCDYMIRPLLETKMVSTNYASIKGRGTDKMYEDIMNTLNRKLKNGEEFSVVAADFKGYFASINTEILREMLGKYIKDKRVLDLVMLFSPEEKGLSLGNEISQIPASFFPSMIDHTMKDKHRLSYFRYMDDTLCIVPKGIEDGYIKSYQALAERLCLVCPDSKFSVYDAEKNFAFCKERFVYNKNKGMYDRLINPKIVSNEKKKLKSFARKVKAGQVTKEDALKQYKGVVGSIKHHPHTHKYVQELEALADVIRNI